MGLNIFTGDRKENIIKTLCRSRLARVGLIGCSIYVYRSYDFGGTMGHSSIKTSIDIYCSIAKSLTLQNQTKQDVEGLTSIF